jgi:reversibly glycosylated polypeptide/UDP-arabinopyranose mutase
MIAIIVPTIREEKFKEFMYAWQDLFLKHDIRLYVVNDGDKPTVNGMSVKEVMGEYSDLIYNHNDGVRNLGFALAYKDGADIFITLDDDTKPVGDTIQDHLDALNSRHPLGWMNTTNEDYMRGFPYGIREEAECVLSHGVWKGVADFDASTQLVKGITEQTFRRMVIPKGVLFPMCIMNVAVKRCLIPYFYQAPMFKDINRFADIWCGIEAKKKIDEIGWCAYTGRAEVLHERASDPFVNLIKEAKGIRMNENYGDDEYFKLYKKQRDRWFKFITQ